MRTFHKMFYTFMRTLIRPYFYLTGARYKPYTPKSQKYLVLTNHTTNWDFFLSGLVLKRHMYFVASDHIYRLGLVSSIIRFLGNPIPRKKGASGDSAVKEILHRMSEGSNVCMAAEGNRSFSGETGFISPRTVDLVRQCNAGLITLVVRGGYFINPRWGTKKRKGPCYAEVVQEYSAEEIARMTDEQLYERICGDLFVDAYADQKKLNAEYKCRNLSENLETALFICPHCHAVSTMKSSGNSFICENCKKELLFNTRGFFESPSGDEVEFPTVTGWYKWQLAYLKDYLISLPKEDVPIFTDDSLSLILLVGDRGKTLLETGRLMLYYDRLEFAGEHSRFSFPLEDIRKMSLVLRGKLFFTFGDNYYEITGQHEYCALKYLISYKFLLGKDYI